jgi:Lrp/AsnC family transcriptional regulator for asnA, asnC and gidA
VPLQESITQTDAKILIDLLKDGRKSFTQIAKECGEKKSTISKRFQELEKSSVVVGSTIQLDYGVAGYNAVGNIEFKIKPLYLEKAIDEIQKVPDIYHAMRIGLNAVNVVATLKTINEFNRLKEMIMRFPTVTELNTNVWMGIRNIPSNLKLTEDYKPVLITTKTTLAPIELDEVDRRIIDMLSKNGRAPFASIASEVGVATNTVIRKYKRLKENGVINTSIQINPLMLGYRAIVAFNLAFNSESNILSIVDELSLLPNIYLMIKTSGQYDLSVRCLIRDLSQLFYLQDAIAGISEVSKSQTFVRAVQPVFPSPRQYISTF